MLRISDWMTLKSQLLDARNDPLTIMTCARAALTAVVPTDSF